MAASSRVAAGLSGRSGSAVQPVPDSALQQATRGEYSMGVDLRTRQALPRDPDVFDAPLGPNIPLAPMPINAPREGGERPDPRTLIAPISYNLPTPPGDIKAVPFQALRMYADANNVARRCIDFRKSGLANLDWAIVLRPSSVKRRGSDFMLDERVKLKRFFQRPDANYSTLSSWLKAMLEELLVLDALPIYLRWTREGGKGKWFGSGLLGLQLLAADTIKPLVDAHGNRPAPPNTAYQQFILGLPRSEFTAFRQGDDAAQAPKPDRQFNSDQLIYEMMDKRANSIYGYSPTEHILQTLLIGIKRMEYTYAYFDEGSVPAAYLYAPPDWTNSQMRQFERVVNETLAGNMAMRHKVKVLPQGAKVQDMKAPVLNSELDMLNIQYTCMGYDVMPSDLGFMPLATQNMTGGRAAATAQAHLGPSMQGLKKSAAFFEDLFNMIIWDVFGLPDDITFKFLDLDPLQDQAALSKVNDTYLSDGVYSIDEVRESLGKEGWGLPETKFPIIKTATGPVPLAAAVQAAGAVAQHQVNTVAAATPGQQGISPVLDQEMRNRNGQPSFPQVPKIPQDNAPAGPGIVPLDDTKGLGSIDVDFYLTHDPEPGADLEKRGRGNAGNIEPLERWYREGGAGTIDWGRFGDFYRCMDHAGKYLPDEEARGFCANRHHEALGVWPGQEDGGRGHKAATATVEPAGCGCGCCDACGPGCQGDCCDQCAVATVTPEVLTPPGEIESPDALEELAALKKYCERRKWRPARVFTSDVLAPAVVKAASASPEAWAWVYKATERRRQDDAAFAPLTARLATHVHAVVRQHASILGPDSAALDTLTGSLADAYAHAYTKGAAFWGAAVAPGDGDALLLAQQQRPYLAQFLTDAAEMSERGVSARAALYARHVHAAYLAAKVRYAPEGTRWVWQATGAQPCAACAARDGQTFTRETLPGIPGTGGFGSHLCAGGPQCSCNLVAAPPSA